MVFVSTIVSVVTVLRNRWVGVCRSPHWNLIAKYRRCQRRRKTRLLVGTVFACFLDSVEGDTSLNRSLETASVGWNSVWMTGRIFDDSTDCVVFMAPDCKRMRKKISRQPVDSNTSVKSSNGSWFIAAAALKRPSPIFLVDYSSWVWRRCGWLNEPIASAWNSHNRHAYGSLLWFRTSNVQ